MNPNQTQSDLVYIVCKIYMYYKNTRVDDNIFSDGGKNINDVTDLLRVCNRKLIFLFLNQNICCGYSKELS